MSVTLDAELAAVFLPEARGHLQSMVDDPAGRVQAAHALKGACAMVGLEDLAAQAEALEVVFRAGGDDPAARAALARALDELAADSPAPAPSLEWDPDELRGLRAFFLDEAAEHLESIDEALAALRGAPADATALASLFRKLHTLKGSAGSVMLDELAARAHALEDRVVACRDRGGALSSDELDELDEGVEAVRRDLAAIARQVRGQPAPPLETAPTPAAAPLEPPRADAQTVRVELERIDELMNAASELVFDRTRIARRLQELEGCRRDLEKVRGSLTAALPDLDARAPIDLAARVREVATELSDVLSSLARTATESTEDAEGLARTSATLQEGLRRVRMMTVGRLFARMAQPVRELARKQHKEVTVVTEGEEAEIDKAVVERVAEPLIHLVRNAVAHGIEDPAARRAAGKPPIGTITLSARHHGDATEIVVADDGRGIDLDGVRRTLVAQRRVTAEQAAALDEESLYATLFEPGISTRLSADDLAGRGVGLDAVKDAIGRLGGHVRVRSQPGRGAMFIVRLPATTSVQLALLFKVGGQVYAVPAARVREAAQITMADVRAHEDREWVALRDGELPLVRLGALLGVPPPPGLVTRAALVLTVENETFAMTCDKVIGPREIVVRSLGPLLAPLPLYAGATISGAGKVQLILDVAHLAEHARHGVRGARPSRPIGPRRVLVVDDSRSIRETASLILQQGGYAVESVPDGWDAWELLQDRPFDLLLTDLEMPRLDGHELIAKVRKSELRRLPILAVSSRTAEATRARVLGEGADGFIPKPLRRRVLLDAVESALRVQH